MTDDLYYRKLESTSTTDLVDVIREKDKSIADLEKKNTDLQKSYEELYNSMRMIKDQRNKAKEIIKTLADDLSMYSGNYQKELLEAKQFLKE